MWAHVWEGGNPLVFQGTAQQSFLPITTGKCFTLFPERGVWPLPVLKPGEAGVWEILVWRLHKDNAVSISSGADSGL